MTCTPVPSGTYTFNTTSVGSSFKPLTQVVGDFTVPIYNNIGVPEVSTTECAFNDSLDENYFFHAVSIEPIPRTFTFTSTTHSLVEGVYVPEILSSTITLTPVSTIIDFDFNLARPEDSLIFRSDTFTPSLMLSLNVSNSKECIAVGSLFNGYVVTKVYHFITGSNTLDSDKVHYIEIDTSSSTNGFNTSSVYEDRWRVVAGWSIPTVCSVLGIYISTNKSIVYSPYFSGSVNKNENFTDNIFTQGNFTIKQNGNSFFIEPINSANTLSSSLTASSISTNEIIVSQPSFSVLFSDTNNTLISTSNLTSVLSSNASNNIINDSIQYKLSSYNYNNIAAINPSSEGARRSVNFEVTFAFSGSEVIGEPLNISRDSRGNITSIIGFPTIDSTGATVSGDVFILRNVSYQATYNKNFLFRIQEGTTKIRNLFNPIDATTNFTSNFNITDASISCFDTSNFLTSGYLNITSYRRIDSPVSQYSYINNEVVYYNSKTDKSFTEVVRNTNNINLNYNLNNNEKLFYIITQTKSWLDFDAEFNVGNNTFAYVLDIPYINKEFIDGLYVVSPNKNASIFYSFDNVDYILANDNISNEPVYGIVTEYRNNFTIEPQLIDNVNTITIRPINGIFSSFSENEFNNNAGNIVIGNELLRYKNATLNTDGTYTLLFFVRGNNGTENYIYESDNFTPQIKVGDVVILVNNSTAFIPLDAEEYINETIFLKVGSKNSSINPLEIEYKAISLRPYAPTQLSSSRDVNGNITTMWERRDRKAATAWSSGNNIPLSETSESYILEIYSSSSYTDVIRTETLSSPNYTYTSARQVQDFGSNQTLVFIKLYQVSSIYGRGEALTTVA